ncbi:MAG TPA: DUF2344 domain-containing protein [Candidatus Pullichristensenella avicola]|nr:DUF2344 domain-containing protein [Candidatus Pullichristensenella avicola]
MRMLLRFGKNRRLRFVSHLDMQRFFQRALNRTGLPIAFSQGFNPHPVMSFASALAMGWTSEYEVLDVKLSAPMGRGRVEEAMRQALPEDLPVLGARMVDDRFPAAMALVRCADYRITPEGEGAPAILAAAEAFCAAKHVMGVRKTKSGEREIDMRPLALSLEAREGSLYARLMLTERDTLKPDVLLAGLAGLAGVEAPRSRVHRLRLLGEDAAGEIAPLMELKSV